VKPRASTPIKFMADIEEKDVENVGGQFYLDEQCLDCDLYRETAPDNFAPSDKVRFKNKV